MLIVYNDYKNEDWLRYQGGMPEGTIILINNQDYNEDVLAHLFALGYSPLYVNKLCEDAPTNTMSLDAENYCKDIVYTEELGRKYQNVKVLLPEYLGGDKYDHYNAFLLGVMPKIVCMERSYNEWKPWILKELWDRNKYLRDTCIKTCIGIWPESFPWYAKWFCAPIQYWAAKIISGNNIFWYSETKELPRG